MAAQPAGSTGMTTSGTAGRSSSSSTDGLQHHPGASPSQFRRFLSVPFAPAPPPPARPAPAPPAFEPPALPGANHFLDSETASDASAEMGVQQKRSDSQPELHGAEARIEVGSGTLDDPERLDAAFQSAVNSDKLTFLRLRSSSYNKHANQVHQLEKSGMNATSSDSESDSPHVYADAFCAICFLHPLDPRNTVAIYHFQNQEEGIQQHSERFCRSCLGKWAQRREFELPKGVSMVDHQVVARLRESIANKDFDVDTDTFIGRRQDTPMWAQDDVPLNMSNDLELGMMERGEFQVMIHNRTAEGSSHLCSRDDGIDADSNLCIASSALAVPNRCSLSSSQNTQASASASSASSPAHSFVSRVDSSASTIDQTFTPKVSSKLNRKVSFSSVPSALGSQPHADLQVRSSHLSTATMTETPAILTAALRNVFRERAADKAQSKQDESDIQTSQFGASALPTHAASANIEEDEFLNLDKEIPVPVQDRVVHPGGHESELLRRFAELTVSPIPPMCNRVLSLLRNPLDQREDLLLPSMTVPIPSPMEVADTEDSEAHLPGPQSSIGNPKSHQPQDPVAEVSSRTNSKSSDSGGPPNRNHRPKRTPVFFENSRFVDPQFVRDARALGLEKLPCDSPRGQLLPFRDLAKTRIDSSRYGQLYVRDSDAREAAPSVADFVLEVDPDYPLVCPICNRLGRKVEVNLLNRCMVPPSDCGRVESAGRAQHLGNTISKINCSATAASSSSHGRDGLACGLPAFPVMFSVLPLPSCVPPRRLFLIGEPEISVATTVQSLHDSLRDLDRRYHRLLVCVLSLLTLCCLSISAGCLIYTFTEDPHW